MLAKKGLVLWGGFRVIISLLFDLPHCECGRQKGSMISENVYMFYALRSIYDQEISLYVGD